MPGKMIASHTGQLKKLLPKFIKNNCQESYDNLQSKIAATNIQNHISNKLSVNSNCQSENITPIILEQLEQYASSNCSFISLQSDVNPIHTPTKQIEMNSHDEIAQMSDNLNNSNAPMVQLNSISEQTHVSNSISTNNNGIIKSTSVINNNIFDLKSSTQKIKNLKKNRELHPNFISTLNPKNLTEEQLLVQLLAKYEPALLVALQRHRKIKKAKFDEEGNMISQDSQLSNMSCMAETPSQFMGKLQKTHQAKVASSIKKQTIIDNNYRLKTKVNDMKLKIQSTNQLIAELRVQLKSSHNNLLQQLNVNEQYEEQLCDMKIAQSSRLGF